MTRAQALLLRRLIQTERDHHEAVVAYVRNEGEGASYPRPDSRWIEVFGATQRTAGSLADAGLAELEGRIGSQLWVRLAQIEEKAL